ncbi:hypothetical protein JCM8202v2_000880 [Rhodotorula sphaerocarpa]
MATAASLRLRKDQIVEQYHEHGELVHSVQQHALEEVVAAVTAAVDPSAPAPADSGNLAETDAGPDEQQERSPEDEGAILATTALLQDKGESPSPPPPLAVTVFRFCRRARFSHSGALKLLHATCQWRLSSGLLRLSPETIPPLYLANPLFFFHPDLRDRFGRPCAVLNLRHVQRTEDGSLDALKDYARFGWEVARRYLSDLSRKAEKAEQDPTLQMVVIVDLEQAGMSNLEVELLPFFLDLLKNNFPGMVGAIFVLNYGWAYAGMWQLAKRVLPNTALERILFPSKEELLEFFDESNLLVEHGGKVQYSYSPANPILQKYGRSQLAGDSLSSPLHSRAPSRALSSSSLNRDFFPTSSAMTPAIPTLSRRSSASGAGLRIEANGPAEAAGPASPSSWFSFGRSSRARRPAPGTDGHLTPNGLRRVRSLASLQQRLEQTQREIDSEDSVDESASDAETRFDEAGESPYNTSNPHFGYPAYVPPSSLDPSGTPRSRFPRRRKRDLVRTLTYLAALRFLALHRAIRYRLNFFVAVLLRLTGLAWFRSWRSRRRAGGGALHSGHEAADKKVVHWQASPASASRDSSSSSLDSIAPPPPHGSPRRAASSHAHTPTHAQPPLSSVLVHTATSSGSDPVFPPNTRLDLDPSLLYLALLFLLLRTPDRLAKVGALSRALVVDVPVWTAATGRRWALRALLGRERAEAVLRAEHRA